MIEFEIEQLLPKFLLNDANGYALAKALEKGLHIFLETVQSGVETVLDIDKMPEWRLDEMAWETGSLYDYSADIEAKRDWIKNAVPYFASYGTLDAIYKYLNGYFESVEVEENWQYGGLPYHFRVTVSGEINDATEAWARKAIETTKNVRSILDVLMLGSTNAVKIISETGKYRFNPPVSGTLYAGMYPQE